MIWGEIWVDLENWVCSLRQLLSFIDVCSFRNFLAEKCYWVAWFRLLGLWSAFFKGFWLVRLLGLKVWNFVGLVKHDLSLLIRLLSKFSSIANHCCICCFPINFQNLDWLVMIKWFIALYLRGIAVLGVWWLYCNASPSLCCGIKFNYAIS